jgi:hypothetical protein
MYWPFVAATFHVAGFDDKKGTTVLRVYPQHVRLWHMKIGLHAISLISL